MARQSRAEGFQCLDEAHVIGPESVRGMTEVGFLTSFAGLSPSSLTCVTTGFPRKFRTPSIRIACRHIGENLYWGFQKKRTRHGFYKIAEPEKVLLDWIYSQRQEGLPVVPDELNLKVRDKKKLLNYASDYPTPVQQTIHSALSQKEQLPERRNPVGKSRKTISRRG
jgi:hypothetical protein